MRYINLHFSIIKNTMLTTKVLFQLSESITGYANSYRDFIAKLYDYHQDTEACLQLEASNYIIGYHVSSMALLMLAWYYT